MEFIFSSFWHWIGTVILIYVAIGMPISLIANAILYRNKERTDK